jgi:glycosyltransferase involved in cell wall biosynthesis
VRHLLFIPTYNEAQNAHRLAKQIARDPRITHTLIVDDSDDPQSAEYAASIDDPETTVIRRPRSGKWSAWRIALQETHSYDGVIQSDSDIRITHPQTLVTGLETHDLATAYQDVAIPHSADPVSRRIGETYSDAHRRLRALGKFNMGGRFMALSSRLADTLLHAGLFNEPVHADDHVIALAAVTLGFRCTSIDCGAEFTTPATIRDWMRYRSRHSGAIGWSERYVAEKIGHPERVREASQADIRLTTTSFLASMTHRIDPLSILALTILAASPLLAREDPSQWRTLTTTKETPVTSFNHPKHD